MGKHVHDCSYKVKHHSGAICRCSQNVCLVGPTGPAGPAGSALGVTGSTGPTGPTGTAASASCLNVGDGYLSITPIGNDILGTADITAFGNYGDCSAEIQSDVQMSYDLSTLRIGDHDPTASAGIENIVVATTNTVNAATTTSLIVGTNNTASATVFNSVIGGTGNHVSGRAVLVVGEGNTVGVDSWDSIVGGARNTVTGLASNIVAGHLNTLDNFAGFNLVVGQGNSVSFLANVVAGTSNNTDSTSSLIVGTGNIVSGVGLIVGGTANTVDGRHHVVGGGTNNVSGTGSFVGGESNTVSGAQHLVGGSGNTVSGLSNIVGGSDNVVSTVNGNANIVSGEGNTVSNLRNIVNGINNTVSGVQNIVSGGINTVSGDANIVGGGGNTVSGISSIIMGSNNIASSYGTLAIGDGNSVAAGFINSAMIGTDLEVTVDNSMIVGNQGRMYDGTYGGGATGIQVTIQLANGAGAGGGTSVTTSGIAVSLISDIAGADPSGYGLATAWFGGGADYCEYLEWWDGNPENEDRVGYFVTLKEGKIVLAPNSASVVGVVSGTPSFVGDAAPLAWKGTNLRDDFGRPVTRLSYRSALKTNELLDEPDDEHLAGKLNRDPVKPVRVHVPSPDYDPNRLYVPRSQRPEWSSVGLIGKIWVRSDGSLDVGNWCSCSNGIAVQGTKWAVLERGNNNVIKILLH